MTRLPQLTHLILNYYRENPNECKALQMLLHCKLSRRWGVFSISCPNYEVYTALLQVQNILKEPLSQLRLAKKLRITVKHQAEEQILLLTTFKKDSWEQDFKNSKLHR
jgi:hypothetical protein